MEPKSTAISGEIQPMHREKNLFSALIDIATLYRAFLAVSAGKRSGALRKGS